MTNFNMSYFLKNIHVHKVLSKTFHYCICNSSTFGSPATSKCHQCIKQRKKQMTHFDFNSISRISRSSFSDIGTEQHGIFNTSTIQPIYLRPYSNNSADYNGALKTLSKSETLRQSQTLDQVIFQLNSDIRAKKRIFHSDIKLILNLYEKGTSLGQNGAFLISCCGDLIPNIPPRERVDLAQIIWTAVKKSGLVDQECCDSLLKCYTDNEYTDFDSLEFLDEMKSLGFKSIETTYYYSFLSLCQKGDVNNAVKILNYMKEEELPVDEEFFSALVLGNARAGDITSAKNILQIMKSSKVDPTAKTHAVLLQAYIESGNVKELENAYSTAIKSVEFTEDILLKLAKIAAQQENPKLFQNVLSWIRDSGQYSFDTVNTVTQLVCCGHSSEGFAMLQKMSRSVGGQPVGSFFIKAMIQANTESGIVISICDSMQNGGLNAYAFNIAAESCLKLKKFSMAIHIFEEMQKRNITLRGHYFLPIVLHEFHSSGFEGLNQTLKKMTTLDTSPDWEMLHDWIIPRLFTVERDPIQVAKILKTSTNISYSSGVMSAILAFLLKNHRIVDASNFVKNLKARVKEPNIVMQCLFNALTEFDQRERFSMNLKLSVQILKFVSANIPEEDKIDYVGQFLVRLKLSMGSVMSDVFDVLLKDLADERIPLSEASFEALELSVNHELKINHGLEVSHMNSNGGRDLIHPRHMDIGALQSHLEELTSKGMNTRGALRRLFLKYCQSNQISEALELKVKFENQFEKLSTGMLSALLGLYVKNNILEPALVIFNSLKSQPQDSMNIDLYKILDLATLMIENGKLTEARRLIQQECVELVPKFQANSVTRNVVRLLEALSKTVSEDLDSLKTTIDFLIEKSIAEPIAPVVGILIIHYIEKGNIELAVDEFIHYGLKHKIVPARQRLMYAILDNEVLLNKAFDCCVAVNGKIDATHDLAFAKSDVGNVDGAAKLLLSLGNNISFNKIHRQCEFLSGRREVQKLLNLAKAVSMTGRNYDCSRMYLIALKECRRLEDNKGLQRIIATMQEEDLHIPPDFAESLGRARNST